ncbi:MAG: hypothetical protein ABS68_07960 [Niastella sp. SCN 39-18]|nr:OmpH family outer membrane protein [Sphingobacteriales bacterium]ODT52513.1 MAG: hypothetical protein ABS68_07960 [Niastella sp. SCN 39-18]OJW11653.1 MAG: hypothetical protein BGO53_12030 [Sphingobacteriales bacterium 39-19]
MKKLIVVCLMAFGMLTNVTAQNKIGHINSDELLSDMPEADKADADLKQYQADLAQRYQDMMKDLSTKDSLFVKDSMKLSSGMKDIRRNELFELYQKAQGFQQQAQDMYQQQAQKLLAPIRAKALDAIKAVAKENGYAYVIDNAQGVLLVSPTGDDLLPLVKKKLGIKDTPASAPAKK